MTLAPVGVAIISAIMVDGHLPNLVVAVAFSFRGCAVRLPCLRWL